MVEFLRNRLRDQPVGCGVMGQRFTPLPTATEEAVAAAEIILGHSLLPTMRQIYRSVAHGGFGPGDGVMGVDGGFEDDQRRNIVARYKWFQDADPEDPTWVWDPSWIPFCHWGSGVYSVVSAIEPYPVFLVDPGAKEASLPMQSIVFPNDMTFDGWIGGWLKGEDLWFYVWDRAASRVSEARQSVGIERRRRAVR